MEWLLLVFLLSLLWLWWDGVGAKEIAVRQGKTLCQQSGVLFLDDSVALTRLRVRRQPSGSMALCRRFAFEFCTDGDRRYSGYVEMAGRHIVKTQMEVFRLVEDV